MGCDQAPDPLQQGGRGLSPELDVHASQRETFTVGVRVHDTREASHDLGHGREHLQVQDLAEVHVHAPQDEAGDVGVAAARAADDLPGTTWDGLLAPSPVVVARCATRVLAHQARTVSADAVELADHVPASGGRYAVELHVESDVMWVRLCGSTCHDSPLLEKSSCWVEIIIEWYADYVNACYNCR